MWLMHGTLEFNKVKLADVIEPCHGEKIFMDPASFRKKDQLRHNFSLTLKE